MAGARVMRRFWKQVFVRQSAEGWQIWLDSRQLKTPLGAGLDLPSAALASSIAGEWECVEKTVKPEMMPQFSLAATVLDRVRPQRQQLIDEMTGYGMNDLICYRTGSDDRLAARQRDEWDPWLDWLAERHGVRLAVTDRIMPLDQPQSAGQRWPAILAGLDDWQLCVLVRAAQLGGSAVLGLALVERALEPGDLYRLALLDELWQAEKWGEDSEAADRRAAIAAEMAEAGRLLSLLEAG